MWIHKIIYLIGKELRNPKMKIHEKNLLKTDFASINELKELQLQRLKNLLSHAKKNSTFYNNLLSNIDINNITLNEFKKIPTLTKNEFRNNIANIQNYIPNEKYFPSSTSGSSGEALTFDRGLDWDAATRATITRGYSWYGVKPWMKNLYFWGYNPSWKKLLKIRFTDFLVNRYRVFSYDEKTINKIKKYLKNCDYIEGYSSSIYSLSKKLEEKNCKYNNIKMVKGTAEMIYDSYHKSVKNVFNRKMISEYGSAESGVIAFECPNNNMHIAIENVLIEQIDDRLIVTNLFSHTAPIIRYELGDYVKIDFDYKCSCGRNHPVLKEITGRIGSKIYGIEGEYPSLSIYYIFKNIVQKHGFVMSYYTNQTEKGELNFNVIYNESNKEEIISLIKKESYVLFKADLNINIKFISKLESKNKKTQSFESFM